MLAAQMNGLSSLAGLLGFPGIEQRNAGRLEVQDVASDDRQTVNHRRRGDQGVASGARIGDMKASATLRHGHQPRSAGLKMPSPKRGGSKSKSASPCWASASARLILPPVRR